MYIQCTWGHIASKYPDGLVLIARLFEPRFDDGFSYANVITV